MEWIILLKQTVPLWVKVSAGFIIGFAITSITIPTIVRVARMKDLCAIPNKRTSHTYNIPNLGGMAVFSAFLISVTTVAGDSLSSNLFYVVCGLVILFFTGMKDDVLIIDPKKKLAAQIIVAVIIAVMADIKIENLFQIFHIGTIPYIPSIVLTVFIILLIINGFNLIDGIDGLASGAGIVTSLFFGLFFWNVRDPSYTIISFSLAGSLIGFFIYNVFGSKNKIFLGDTGSLILGLTISVLMIRFLSPNSSGSDKLLIASPALAVGILILPLFDTIRVFVIRIYQGKSPFAADHQHIHHLLLALGFSHLKSTAILLSFNIFFILFCFLLKRLGNLLSILLIFSTATFLSVMLAKLEKRHRVKIPGQIIVKIPKETVTLEPQPEPEEAELMNA